MTRETHGRGALFASALPSGLEGKQNKTKNNDMAMILMGHLQTLGVGNVTVLKGRVYHEGFFLVYRIKV